MYSKEEVVKFKKSLGSLWNVLITKDYVWHSTELNRLDSIMAKGIRPFDGLLHSNYPQSLGAHFKSVCLFDFQFRPEDKVLSSCYDWSCYLSNSNSPVRIIFGIDKKDLITELYFDQDHRKYTDLQNSNDPARCKKQFIWVESWFQGIITPDILRKVLLVSKIKKDYVFEEIHLNSEVHKTIEAHLTHWKQLERIAYEKLSQEQQSQRNLSTGLLGTKILQK